MAGYSCKYVNTEEAYDEDEEIYDHSDIDQIIDGEEPDKKR